MWPAIAGGLPASLASGPRAGIALAERRAAGIALPRFLDAEGALTGPAAQLSGLVKGYARLSQRGWEVLAMAAAAGSTGASGTVGTGATGAAAVGATGATNPAATGATNTAATGAARGGHDGRAGRIGAPAAPSAMAFLRANSGLYIYSVYDGHFELSLVGKKLQDAYRKLGGAQGFAGTLGAAEVEALARAYSEGAVRLQPHPAGRVGV